MYLCALARANEGRPRAPRERRPGPTGALPRHRGGCVRAGPVPPPPFLGAARELGLRPAAFGALRTLDRPRTMSEIAAVLHCDNSNVTGIVAGLQETGLGAR